MKLVAKIGVFAVALALSAMPAMACLLSTAALTADEHECCKRMANQCGKAGMPTSHSCCQRLTGPENNFLKSDKVQIDHIANNSYVADISAALVLTELPVVHASLDVTDHGPPGSPPATISVLRI